MATATEKPADRTRPASTRQPAYDQFLQLLEDGDADDVADALLHLDEQRRRTLVPRIRATDPAARPQASARRRRPVPTGLAGHDPLSAAPGPSPAAVPGPSPAAAAGTAATAAPGPGATPAGRLRRPSTGDPDERVRREGALLVAGAGCLPTSDDVVAWLRSPRFKGDFPARTIAAIIRVLQAPGRPGLATVATDLAAQLKHRDHDRGEWSLTAAMLRAAGLPLPLTEPVLRGWVRQFSAATSPGALAARLAEDPWLETQLPALLATPKVATDLGDIWPAAVALLAAGKRIDRRELIALLVARLRSGDRGAALRPVLETFRHLDPTPAERAAHRADFLAMLTEPNGPVAELAQRVLRTLDEAGHLDADTVAAAMRAAFARTEKKLVRAQVAWLDRAISRHPSAAPALLEAATSVLDSDDPEVAERALRVVGHHSAGPDVLRPAAESLAGDLRRQADEIIGETSIPPGPRFPPSPMVYVPEPMPPAINSLPELTATLARTPLTPVDLERVLAAVTKFAARSRPDLAWALAPHTADKTSPLTDLIQALVPPELAEAAAAAAATAAAAQSSAGPAAPARRYAPLGARRPASPSAPPSPTRRAHPTTTPSHPNAFVTNATATPATASGQPNRFVTNTVGGSNPRVGNATGGPKPGAKEPNTFVTSTIGTPGAAAGRTNTFGTNALGTPGAGAGAGADKTNVFGTNALGTPGAGIGTGADKTNALGTNAIGAPGARAGKTNAIGTNAFGTPGAGIGTGGSNAFVPNAIEASGSAVGSHTFVTNAFGGFDPENDRRMSGARRSLPPPEEMVRLRIRELADQLARGEGPPALLATPATQDGHVDPARLLLRLASAERAGWQPGPHDLAQALLRLPRETPPTVLTAAARLNSTAGRRFAAWLRTGGLADPAITVVASPGGGPAQRGVAFAPVDASGLALPPGLLAAPGGRAYAAHSDGSCWPMILPSHREIIAAHVLHSRATERPSENTTENTPGESTASPVDATDVQRGAPAGADQRQANAADARRRVPGEVGRRDADGSSSRASGEEQREVAGGAGVGLLSSLARCSGPFGPAMALVLTQALTSGSESGRQDAVGAIAHLARCGGLDAGLLGRELALVLAARPDELHHTTDALADLARGGSQHAVWAIMHAVVPALLRLERPPAGLPDLLALATAVAAAINARAHLPEVAAAAALPERTRLKNEAARLARTLA